MYRTFSLSHFRGLKALRIEGLKRGRGLFQQHAPKEVHVLSKRPSFYPPGHAKAGKTDATAYAIFIWRNGLNYDTDLRWLDWR